MIQRPYVLRRKNAELIFLFEDRAQGSAVEVTMFADIAAAIAARAGTKLHDIGMVEGHGGVLGVWGAHEVPGPRRRCRWRAKCGCGAMQPSPADLPSALLLLPSSCG
jgi:hypothetical protein